MSRPDRRSTVSLPESVAVLPPIARLLALAVDLLPSAVITLVILRVPPTELLNIPLLSLDLASCLPYLLSATITVTHATVLELITGASVGKLLFGARIVADGGKPAPATRLLLRAVLKYAVLLIPPLAMLALFNPNLQGIGDVVAGTAVVHDRPASAEDADRGR